MAKQRRSHDDVPDVTIQQFVDRRHVSYGRLLLRMADVHELQSIDLLPETGTRKSKFESAEFLHAVKEDPALLLSRSAYRRYIQNVINFIRTSGAQFGELLSRLGLSDLDSVRIVDMFHFHGWSDELKLFASKPSTSGNKPRENEVVTLLMSDSNIGKRNQTSDDDFDELIYHPSDTYGAHGPLGFDGRPLWIAFRGNADFTLPDPPALETAKIAFDQKPMITDQPTTIASHRHGVLLEKVARLLEAEIPGDLFAKLMAVTREVKEALSQPKTAT